jgi:quinoprotein glucose dehydrogenase
VFPRSGFVVLASGLIVFVDNQAKLYALDKDTGKVVFTRDMPNSAIGVPAVYEVDGREYILFPLLGGPGFPGGAKLPPGGVNPPVGPRRYVAVALPAK